MNTLNFELDDNDVDIDATEIFKKDVITKKSNGWVEICKSNLEKQFEDLQFNDKTEEYLNACNDYDYAFRYKVSELDELKELIGAFLNFTGNYEADLNWIDTSDIKDMSHLFENSRFNGDISKWNVSNVTNMACMFECSKFNGNISKWDASNVTNMEGMFRDADFHEDISKWDVSKVKNIDDMFEVCHLPYTFMPYTFIYNKINNSFIRLSIIALSLTATFWTICIVAFC